MLYQEVMRFESKFYVALDHHRYFLLMKSEFWVLKLSVHHICFLQKPLRRVPIVEVGIDDEQNKGIAANVVTNGHPSLEESKQYLDKRYDYPSYFILKILSLLF